MNHKITEEEYNSLKDENSRLAEEILKLKFQLSKGKATKIPVSLYHHILKSKDMKTFGWGNNDSVISLESFTEQMKYLYDNGFHTATMEELEGFLKGEIDLPKDTVVITFDDGYLSNGEYAYKVMTKYNFKGTIFMMGRASNRPLADFDPKGLQYIHISQLDKYKDVFQWGCHTYKLHSFNKNNQPLLISSSEKEIIDDLSANKKEFQTNYIAYPYGRYNKNTIKIVENLGYKLGFTVKSGYVTTKSNKYELPRFIISPRTSINNFKSIVTQ